LIVGFFKEEWESALPTMIEKGIFGIPFSTMWIRLLLVWGLGF
jgi:hypothetical protein